MRTRRRRCGTGVVAAIALANGTAKPRHARPSVARLIPASCLHLLAGAMAHPPLPLEADTVTTTATAAAPVPTVALRVEAYWLLPPPPLLEAAAATAAAASTESIAHAAAAGHTQGQSAAALS